MGQVVLVTGVSRHLGGRFADLLGSHPAVDHVIGVDVVPPPHGIGRAEFVRADIRNPVMSRVIAAADVDTVVHLNVIATPVAGSRTSMKEINVIGTMQLLAACQKAAGVQRLVVKSSASVYGASPRDPALFDEDTNAKALPRNGLGRDSVEVEGYVRGFARRRPDVALSVLRFANIIGPRIVTPMTDYLGLPVIPTVMGFDSRLQLVHEDDALGALLAATLGPGVGTVNVAGDGVLLLSQAARIAGRPTLPVPQPAAGWVGRVMRRAGLAELSAEQLALLTYGRALDTTRMRRVLGFEPAFTTRAALEDLVAAGRGSRPLLLPALVDLTRSAQHAGRSGRVVAR